MKFRRKPAAEAKDAEIARLKKLSYRCEAHEDDECPECACCAVVENARLEAENALLLASQPPPPEPTTDTATTIPPGSTPCVELAELQSLLAQSSRDYVEQAKRLAELAAENDCLRKALARYNPKQTP